MKHYFCADTGETANTYEEYLQTKHWRTFRKRIADMRGWKCEHCGKKIEKSCEYNVHHKTYKRVGREEPEDVLFLCRDCHVAEHKRLDEIKAKKKQRKAAKAQKKAKAANTVQNNKPKHKKPSMMPDTRSNREIKLDAIIANIYRLDNAQLSEVHALVMKHIANKKPF